MINYQKLRDWRLRSQGWKISFQETAFYKSHAYITYFFKTKNLNYKHSYTLHCPFSFSSNLEFLKKLSTLLDTTFSPPIYPLPHSIWVSSVHATDLLWGHRWPFHCSPQWALYGSLAHWSLLYFADINSASGFHESLFQFSLYLPYQTVLDGFSFKFSLTIPQLFFSPHIFLA